MRNYIMSKIEKRKPTYKLPFKLCFYLSLLSGFGTNDPRDYKSRALAN